MVTSTLVDSKIEAGRWLLEQLDHSKFEVKSALWSFSPDSNDWRLLIATPLVDSKGPREAYLQLQRLMTALKRTHPSRSRELGLWDIQVVGSNDQLVRLLRSVVKTGRGLSGLRFSRNTINGVYIEDAYIYRLS